MRSVHAQKHNKVNHEHDVTHAGITNVISQVNNSTKRKLSENHDSTKVINENRRKDAKINSRKQAKTEAQIEDIIVMKTPR